MGLPRSFAWLGLLLAVLFAAHACALEWVDDPCAVCHAVQSSALDASGVTLPAAPPLAVEPALGAPDEHISSRAAARGLQSRAPPA